MAKKIRIDAETDESIYEIGKGIQLLSFDMISSMNAKDPLEVIKMYKKHNIGFYFVSTMVHACQIDGILGRKEAIFIDNGRKFWGVLDSQYKECLIGKDYSIELCVAWMAVYLHFHPNSSKSEFKKALNNFKKQLILMTIIASTQDGILEDKNLNQIKKIATNIAITPSEMNKCIDIAKLHIQMATKLKDLLQ